MRRVWRGRIMKGHIVMLARKGIGHLATILILTVMVSLTIWTQMTTMMGYGMKKTLTMTTMEFRTNWKAIQKMKEEVLHRAVLRIQSSLRCATTRTVGSGWTGSLQRGTPGCLVSWGTRFGSGLLGEAGNMNLG